MRTTLTLDPDVAEQLRKAVAKGDQTFKDVVNAALRRGLKGPDSPAQKKRFVQRPWPGGGSEMLLTIGQIKDLLLDDDIEKFREAGRR
jgi:hypothetical protein